MAANKTLKFNNTIKSFSSTNDQISNTKEKIYYCMRTIALLLLFLTFAFTAFMVIYIPPLDANWWTEPSTIDGVEYAGGIDIGLHDQMFFAWKRSHIEVGMLDLSNPLALNDEIKTTSPVTGSYLHIAGIVITIIDLLCITFSIYLMCAKQKTLNLNKHYKIISIMTISGMSILLIMAYVMRSGAVFGAFFNIELNTKFNRNIVEYLGWVTDQSSKKPSVYCLDAEYTQLGIASISTLACYGGLCVSAAFIFFKNHFLELNTNSVSKPTTESTPITL